MLIVQNTREPAAIRNGLVDMIAGGVSDMRIASAYVTLGGVNILQSAVAESVGAAAFAALQKTLITSFDYGITDPQALRHWRTLDNSTILVAGAQRLAQGTLMPHRAYHPKLYAFGKSPETCSALVGSANLTNRGFSVNTEAAWVQNDVPRAVIDSAFDKALFETVPLTDEMLEAYEALRHAQPPPREIALETQPVAAPVVELELPLFRLAIESGAINPANYTAMWVHGEALQGGSQNQLELPRGGHRFFGFVFDQYDYPHNLTIGEPVLRSGAQVWNDRRLTWHGNNRMERMNLPTARQGGFNYADSAVMFRRLADGTFELFVTNWDSDIAHSWRQASIEREAIFRLGTVATNRMVGLV